MAVVVAILFAAPAAAQDETSISVTPTPARPLPGPQPEITLIAQVGFDPDFAIVKRGSWARISVLLTNDRRSVEGFLRVRKRDREHEFLIYLEQIDLPFQSRKLWTGYVLADDDPNELLVEYLTTRGRILAQEPVSYIARPPDDDLVLAIVPRLRRTGLRQLIGVAGRDPDRAFPRAGAGTGDGRAGRHLLFTQKALLPREVIGYESVSVFLWDGDDLSDLDPERALALKGWVYQGGTLVVAGGENGERVRQSFLNEILPVEILGTDSADLAGDFRRMSGSAPTASGPTLISTVRVSRGRIIMGTTERPIVVEGTYGAGRVIFVTFSLTALAAHKWDASEEFFGDLFRPARSCLLSTLTGEARFTIDARLKSNLLAELPTPFFILAFLGLYIVLVVPVNYGVFRALKRPEYAWMALPVVAIAFGFVAYHIGYFSQSRTLDSDEISFVEGVAGCPLARAKTFYAIYSPTGTNEPIRFPDVPVFAGPLLPTGFAASRFRADMSSLARNPLTVVYRNGFEVFDFAISTWAARSLECDHVTDLGGQLDAVLTFDGANLKGTVTNHLGYPLHEAAILLPSGRAHRLGPMGQNTTIPIDLTELPQSPSRPFSPRTGGGISGPAPASAQLGGFRGEAPEQGEIQAWMADALNQTRRRSSGRHTVYQVEQMPFLLPVATASANCWFGSEFIRVVPPNACLLVGLAQRSLLKPEVGQGRSRRILNQRSHTLVHLIVLPFSMAIEQVTAVSEVFWSVEHMIGTAQGVPRERDIAIENYLQTVGGGGRAFRLVPGSNIFALRPTIEWRGRSLDSLTVRFQLDKGSFSRGGGSGAFQPLPYGGFTVALYNFAHGNWQSFGSTMMIECRRGAQEFFDSKSRQIQLKIEVTDPQVEAELDRWRLPRVNCFLRNIRVNATLK